jgi:hypothetical protein
MVGLCGDESHQSFAPEHGHGTRAAMVAACAADSKTAEKRHRTRGDAGRMGPSAPPGSNIVTNRFPDQPRALIYHTQRVQPATAASETRQIALVTRSWRPLPAP